ncbi:amino acid--tRNA ligase-related protein [Mangrovicoccus ximenensis]|uniref:amino acid--tRNA ligase-related protein n=1 Tax=Mangrovicoccus ximenensis TaxID=1911570 RepID=UPI001F3FFEC9|nr:amino acid--tRNA ligase-related protein [Mangrovicoccus ximenensis]
MTDTPWWTPARHADRRPVLMARNRAQAAIRGYLAAEDFVEVDPCALAASPGNEAHLHAFETSAIGNDGRPRAMYLHTSPEFAMKKLLAAGEPRIAAFAHVWRNRERGPRHSPEFTMLEWYRTGEDYAVLMEDTAAMARLACEAAGARILRAGDATCDPFLPYERISVAEAFARHAGIDLLATLAADGAADRDRCGAGHRKRSRWPPARSASCLSGRHCGPPHPILNGRSGPGPCPARGRRAACRQSPAERWRSRCPMEAARQRQRSAASSSTDSPTACSIPPSRCSARWPAAARSSPIPRPAAGDR